MAFRSECALRAPDSPKGRPKSSLQVVPLLAALAVGTGAIADETHVAVASNFVPAMETLVRDFEAKTGHKVVLIPGSTGKQYAQIENGAPFDALFSADVERPQKLEADGMAIAGTRFTYAVGKLVLWSPKADYVDAEGAVLRSGDFRHLAMANPELAPYGLAAQQVLVSMGLWETLSPRIVRGENIAQAFQFVDSGNAELGFVAYAQVIRPNAEAPGSFWPVPDSMHEPIEQQAVLLRENAAAQLLLEYVRSEEGLKTVHAFGYSTP